MVLVRKLLSVARWNDYRVRLVDKQLKCPQKRSSMCIVLSHNGVAEWNKYYVRLGTKLLSCCRKQSLRCIVLRHG